MSEPVLRLDNVQKYFDSSESITDSLKESFLGVPIPKVRAVDGIDIDLGRKEVHGIIGESGCGKSTLIETLMGLYTPSGGEIYYDGNPMSEFTRADWKDYRRNVQIIFQDPFNSMDPKFTVRETLLEPLLVHDIGDREDRIMEALDKVELNPPEDYVDRRSHQLSGGEKQRVSIARALVLDPEIILADEPVSMLDVSIQASILKLLQKLVENEDLSMIYISHDLSTVSYICDKVNVMYLGRLVERAATMEILDDPKHPYTEALIQAIPIPDPHAERERTQMTDNPSDPINLPEGCRFKVRCPERMDICDTMPLDVVQEADSTDARQVACHLYYDHEDHEAEATDGSRVVAPGGELHEQN